MRRSKRWVAARFLSDERGFTIIELMVATLVMTIGVIALLGSFDSSRNLTSAGEMHDTANQIAEKEIQRIRSQPWAQLALSATPTTNAGATASDPTYYISPGPCGSSMTPATSPCYQWDWKNTANVEPLVISSQGTDPPTATAWQTNVTTSGGHVRLQGAVYDYITWVKDPSCQASACGGASDYKRITVAVTANGMTQPVRLSTLIQNPDGGATNPLASGATCTDGGAQVPCVN